ncbi:hypothetical protein DV735_g5468, partial [Chaetothyriales sp. CBS 134920]
MMPSKALLGKVASVLGLAGSGMTWAANKLHSQSEDHCEADSRPPSAGIEELQETPKTSPRKVRFASRGHGPRDLGTLPIDMPKKPVPSLPPLELSKVPIMDNLAHTPHPDSIPAARPPETPVLKAQPNDGYFGLLQQGQDEEALPPPISAPKNFAKIDQSEDSVAAPAAPAAPVAPATPPAELTRNSTKSESLMTPTKDSSQEDLTVCPEPSEASSVVFPHVDIDLVIKASYSGRAEDDFSPDQLPSKIETHEDTRQRFRGRPVPKLHDGWASSESDSTGIESPDERCHVFVAPSSHQQDADCLKHRRSATQYDDCSISAVRDTLESISLTDTLKSSGNQPSAPEKAATTCEDIEVTVLLTPSTTSSVSPTRSRRAFRFSNTSEQKSKAESCAKSGKRCSTERAPSPVCLPLPLSIPPKRVSKTCSASSISSPKWSPFQEDGFLYALAVATSREDRVADIHKILSEQGGFTELWDLLQLPEWTAPNGSVPIPSSEQISDMIKTAQATCKPSVSPLDHRGWSPFDEILFAGALVTANNDLGTPALYQWLSSEGGFKAFWKQMRLPDCTAPRDDTRLLHEEICQDMVKQAWRICGQSSDQHGWVPFTETNFPSALISAISAMGYDQVSAMLLQSGGFAKFWKKVMLPRNSAPRDDTRALTAEEMDNIVQKAHRMCGYKREINPEASNKLFQHAVGPAPRPSPTSTVTRHRVLSDAWVRRQQQYSGEVSTIDITLDCAEEVDDSHTSHKTHEQSEGAGARVRRSIGTSSQRHLTPFLLLDHFHVSPGAGFPDHPHRGQETITYLLSGSIDHEDFAGNRGTIGPGDLQFMTAGRGIMHAEMPGSAAADLRAGEIPVAVAVAGRDCNGNGNGGGESKNVEVKVISGRALGVDSLPVVELAYTPVWLLDVTIQPGGRLGENVDVDVGPYHCVIFRQQGDHIVAQHPHDQPIVQYGPFVTTSREAVIQALQDFHNHANGFERAENWESEIGKSMR